MKRKVTLLMLLFLSLVFSVNVNAKPDTTDNWTVLYNTKIMAKLDAESHDKLIVIKTQMILPTDILSLDYWCDAPCTSCTTEMYMDSKKKILLAKSKGSRTRLRVDVVKLFYAWRDNGMKPIGVYYTDGHRDEPVFTITFSN